MPLADVTWVADDGIRYMRPEVVLHHKARLHRPKDTVDLEVAWPLLDARGAGLAARRRTPRARRPPVARPGRWAD